MINVRKRGLTVCYPLLRTMHAHRLSPGNRTYTLDRDDTGMTGMDSDVRISEQRASRTTQRGRNA